MARTSQPYSPLAEPTLAAHAMSAMPAWLWSGDGARLIWANPAAAMAMRNDAGALTARMTQIAQSLPSGATRLERLRGMGAGVGGLLTCRCERIGLRDKNDGILVVAVEPASATPSLGERARALIAECDAPAAVFTAAGGLVEASAAAAAILKGVSSLALLGLGELMAKALHDGQARDNSSVGAVALTRLGNGGGDMLLALFGEPMPAAGAASGGQAAAQEHTDSSAMPPRGLRRFIWHSDDAGRFTILTQEFFARADARTAELSGKPWTEIAATLGLDPDGKVARALASHDTWSGIAVAWPSAGGGQLTVELSGLPVLDRERRFLGYRGFGLCRGETGAAPEPPPISATLPPIAPTAAPAPPVETSTVVPFPSPSLSASEQSAFHELARTLGDRLKATAGKPPADDDFGPERGEPVPASGAGTPHRTEPPPGSHHEAGDERPILDKLPVGILVYRYNTLIYANRALLDWTGYRTLEALTAAGGLDSLFIEPAAGPGTARPGGEAGNGHASKSLAIATREGSSKPVEGRLFSVNWDGESALVLTINTLAGGSRDQAARDGDADRSTELARREIEAENRNLRAALDTAADGVLLLDAAGRIILANASAAALFGRDRDELSDMTFGDLFAPESRRAALDYIDRLGRDPAGGIINPGKEMVARTGTGGLVPLHVTIGRVGPDGERFCAVLRDITALKKAEEELIDARRRAETMAAEKSEFLAKISHDIRTPLNAIIGFSEVMLEQRFGPIGNERYQDYVQGIHASGARLIALLNDLLDLARIETGKFDLAMTQVSLNEIAQQCVAALQPQANRDRVIIRTSLPTGLPPVVADAGAVRQIILNLLAHSIRFTGAGGQVIVSTARNDNGEIVLRVRDTGAGLSERELLSALEPFRDIATSARWGVSGTGLDLPITKALAEANRAKFTITSGSDQGTLVEIAFPAIRVIAE